MGVKVAAPRVVTSPDMKNATVGVIRGVGAALTMVCFAVPAAAESVKRYTIEQFMKRPTLGAFLLHTTIRPFSSAATNRVSKMFGLFPWRVESRSH